MKHAVLMLFLVTALAISLLVSELVGMMGQTAQAVETMHVATKGWTAAAQGSQTDIARAQGEFEASLRHLQAGMNDGRLFRSVLAIIVGALAVVVGLALTLWAYLRKPAGTQ